jgi:CubicO group peptidase (beta-lactamase class C family)
MLRLHAVSLVVFLALAPYAGVAQSRDTLPAGLDGYIRRIMERFEVPGLSVAVVKDDRVLLAKGYGVRALGDPGSVDGETLFGIASNTKVFTATALGILVEEGKLPWCATCRASRCTIRG